MKRIISIILICLLFPVCSLADSMYSDYFGTWINASYVGGEYFLDLIQFFDNGTAYYFSGDVDGGEILESYEYMITWKETADGVELAFPNYTKEFRLYTDGWLTDGSKMLAQRFHKVYPVDVPSDSASKSSGSSSGVSSAAAAVSPADLCGKWSHYWDARDLNNLLGSRGMSFDIRSYDMYLTEDGKAYLDTVTCRNGVFSSGGVLLPGSWTIVEDKITLVLGSDIYFAWMDASGRLFVQMTDSMAMIYEKVNNYNYEEGML